MKYEIEGKEFEAADDRDAMQKLGPRQEIDVANAFWVEGTPEEVVNDVSIADLMSSPGIREFIMCRRDGVIGVIMPDGGDLDEDAAEFQKVHQNIEKEINSKNTETE